MGKHNLQKIEDWKSQVTFDVYNISARDMTSFFEDANANNLEGLAKVYSKVLVSMPKEWGDPQSEADLLDNVPYVCFQQLSRLFVDAFEDAKKS